jgi:hypothetical protein
MKFIFNIFIIIMTLLGYIKSHGNPVGVFNPIYN